MDGVNENREDIEKSFGSKTSGAESNYYWCLYIEIANSSIAMFIATMSWRFIILLCRTSLILSTAVHEDTVDQPRGSRNTSSRTLAGTWISSVTLQAAPLESSKSAGSRMVLFKLSGRREKLTPRPATPRSWLCSTKVHDHPSDGQTSSNEENFWTRGSSLKKWWSVP